MELIDKAAVVAEIERRKKIVEKRLYINNSYSEEGNAAWERDKALYDAYNSLHSSLDTLEVKEVNLEKELESWRHNHFHGKRDKEASGEYLERNSQLNIAEHFFELGLKAQIAIIYKPTEKDIHKLGLKSQKEDTSECFNKDDFFRKVYEWLKGYAFADDENKVHLPTLLHDFLKDSRTM